MAADPARLWHYGVQILMEMASSWSILVTVLYFVFLGDNFDGSDAKDVHAHVMNGKSLFINFCKRFNLVVVIGLEFIFNRIPVRLLHFVYTVLVGLMYILGNYIGYLMNPKRNATYSDFIDWTDNDAGFVLGTIETLLARVLN